MMEPVVDGHPHGLVASGGSAVEDGEHLVGVGVLPHQVDVGVGAVAL